MSVPSESALRRISMAVAALGIGVATYIAIGFGFSAYLTWTQHDPRLRLHGKAVGDSR